MNSNKHKSSFDELVAGISSEERGYILSKMNKNNMQAMPVFQPLKDVTKGMHSLENKYKTESFIYKLILRMRAFFLKRPKMDLYNIDLIEGLAKRVNKNHPGLIDIKNKLLLPAFYEKLKEVREGADFFRPFFSAVNDNPGRFYVYLSTFIAPEISEQINKEADPYQLSFDVEITYSKTAAPLIKKMENVLKSISTDVKAKLYAAIQSLTWFRHFSELPFEYFISNFTSVISESFTCPFENCRTVYPVLAKILSVPTSISNEALQALFLYPQRKDITTTPEELEKNLKDFLSRAVYCVSMIQMFISSVPLTALGKIIFNDYKWQIETYGGGEDWFIKFKDEWKHIFDTRWSQWLRDHKKAQLTSILKNEFGAEKFPELPYRPWVALWGGVPFRCEMTGGFISWFSQNKYSEVIEVLNIIILEGIFINNENRTELSEAINKFEDVNEKIIDFNGSLSEEGSIGSIFGKMISEGIRTLKGQSLIDTAILNAETSIRAWGKVFCDACRDIEKILNGILNKNKEKGYASLQNFSTIRGNENHKFREKMDHICILLNRSRMVLAEIEPLDLPKK